MQLNQLYLERYNGYAIAFKRDNGQIFANATAMCKALNKQLPQWFKLPATRTDMASLETDWPYPTPPIVTRIGKAENYNLVGVWIHEELVLKLANWLDEDFARWCEDKIEQLRPMPEPQDVTKGLFVPDNLTLLAQNLLVMTQSYLQEVAKQNTPTPTPVSRPVVASDPVTNGESLAVTVIADELGYTAEQLNKMLATAGVQRKVSGYWVLNHKYQNKGYTVHRSYPNTSDGGKGHAFKNMRWTPKGRVFIHWLFNPDSVARINAASQLLSEE